MLNNAREVPFKCCFGAPSCVPATSYETAGAELNAEDVTQLLSRDDIYYLTDFEVYAVLWLIYSHATLDLLNLFFA